MGFILTILIVVQILSGLVLSCFYIPNSNLAEISIIYIVNEIHCGYIIQRTHVILASMLFICIYLHIFKAIFFKMYRWSNRLTWWTGLFIFYLLIVEAFTGYILPWGQMSFWGATVITNLLSVIPIVGTYLIKVVWGGSIVGTLTLQRFFMIHYLVPSLILIFILVHLNTIHRIGSTNAHKLSEINDTNFMQLYPYFIIKDSVGLGFILFLSLYLIFFKPFIFDNLVNYIAADSKNTPKHIVPEWYFLSFYIILKLISIKWLGILIMFFFIGFPVILPFLTRAKFLYGSYYFSIFYYEGLLKKLSSYFLKKI